jgi:putative SOS response-associated peptidase YedK
MCGRFCIAASPGEIEERYGVSVPSGFKPRFNLAPGQKVLSITWRQNHPETSFADWGVDIGLNHPLINARVETVHEKPLFRDLFSSHRCLIPASGYYEWKREGRKKRPWFFSSPTDSIIGFAGLIRPGKERDQVLILTTDAVFPCSTVHDRMPVIVNPADEQNFLERGDIRLIQQEMVMYEVSPLVNSVKEDRPDLIRPWKYSSVQQRLEDL